MSVGADECSLFRGLSLGVLGILAAYVTSLRLAKKSNFSRNIPLGAAALAFVDFVVAILSAKQTHEYTALHITVSPGQRGCSERPLRPTTVKKHAHPRRGARM